MGGGPSELELKILRRLWAENGAATVRAVLSGWPEAGVPGYTTVLKTLQIMETKGYVTHSRAGRAYVYRPSIRREHHVRGRLRELLQGLIGQDRLELINTLLDEASLTGKELDEVRGMLAARGRRRT